METSTELDFTFEHKSVYGNDLYYPLSDCSKSLLDTFKRKTLCYKDLCDLKRIGLKIQVITMIDKI